MTNDLSQLLPLTADELARPGNVRHGFFTRLGGVSTGIYASLNCGYGSGDDQTAITLNRSRVRDWLGSEALVTIYQVHSSVAVTVDQPFPPEAAPKADALVTKRSGVALAILTADCVPVLLADHAAGVIGAAHAGWRGTSSGVIEAVVVAMLNLGAQPQRIVAAIGPHIQRHSYEVGPEFLPEILATHPGDADLFTPSVRPGHQFFDLGACVLRRLNEMGVEQCSTSKRDTMTDPIHFFSYRRSRVDGEPDYGRMISAIALDAN